MIQTRNDANEPFRVSSTAQGDRYVEDAMNELGSEPISIFTTTLSATPIPLILASAVEIHL